MCNIMADDDIKMNSFAQATDAAYIYAESSNGSQVKIKKSDLVEVIRGAMPVATETTKGLMPANGIIPISTEQAGDLLNTGSAFGYSHQEDGSGLYGIFLSIKQNSVFQLKASFDGSALKFRVYNQTKQEWSSWKSISFT